MDLLSRTILYSYILYSRPFLCLVFIAAMRIEPNVIRLQGTAYIQMAEEPLEAYRGEAALFMRT